MLAFIPARNCDLRARWCGIAIAHIAITAHGALVGVLPAYLNGYAALAACWGVGLVAAGHWASRGRVAFLALARWGFLSTFYPRQAMCQYGFAVKPHAVICRSILALA